MASDYRVTLLSRKELRIEVTWTQGVAVAGAGAVGGPTGIALAIDDGSSNDERHRLRLRRARE